MAGGPTPLLQDWFGAWADLPDRRGHGLEAAGLADPTRNRSYSQPVRSLVELVLRTVRWPGLRRELERSWKWARRQIRLPRNGTRQG